MPVIRIRITLFQHQNQKNSHVEGHGLKATKQLDQVHDDGQLPEKKKSFLDWRRWNLMRSLSVAQPYLQYNAWHNVANPTWVLCSLSMMKLSNCLNTSPLLVRCRRSQWSLGGNTVVSELSCLYNHEGVRSLTLVFCTLEVFKLRNGCVPHVGQTPLRCIPHACVC